MDEEPLLRAPQGRLEGSLASTLMRSQLTRKSSARRALLPPRLPSVPSAIADRLGQAPRRPRGRAQTTLCSRRPRAGRGTDTSAKLRVKAASGSAGLGQRVEALGPVGGEAPGALGRGRGGRPNGAGAPPRRENSPAPRGQQPRSSALARRAPGRFREGAGRREPCGLGEARRRLGGFTPRPGRRQVSEEKPVFGREASSSSK